MKKSKGFTLVEMVVVLAVVAILAAILTPTIAKNINDAKIARANNECQVIGAAIGSFFKDVGRWPTSDGVAAALPDVVEVLYGPGDLPTAGAAGTDDWMNDGNGTFTEFDTFLNHLVENDPGDEAFDYETASTSELRWRGPYLTEIRADPWASHYSCNINYTFNDTTNMVGIFSAGPDRVADTVTEQASTTFAIGNDDVIFRLQ